MLTYYTVLERHGWMFERARELAHQVARNPEEARHLEQRVSQVARAKAARASRHYQRGKR